MLDDSASVNLSGCFKSRLICTDLIWESDEIFPVIVTKIMN